MTRAIDRLDRGGAEVVGIVDVTVRRVDEVLTGIVRPRGARLFRVERCVETPAVGVVDDDIGRGHRGRGHGAILLHCTSVNGGVTSSCGSKTASTGAPIGTSWVGSPSRLPIMRTEPASGSSTRTTM